MQGLSRFRDGARHGDESVTQERADAFDRLEVVAGAEGADGAAVRERLVDGEVEAILPLLELRSVERACPAFRGGAPAGRALPRRAVCPFLDEQQLDAAIGGCLECLLPAGRGPPVAAGLLLPALRCDAFLSRVPLVHERLHRLEQLACARVRLGRRPADDGAADIVRERVLERRSRLLRGDDHDRGSTPATDLPLELLGDAPEVVFDQLLDVPLVARLRPAALIVPPRLLVELLVNLLEPAVREPVDVAAFTTDVRDEHALTAGNGRDERREVEGLADLDDVRDALAERPRLPDAVQPGGEDGEPVGPLAAELRVEEGAQPFEVGAEPLLLVVAQLPAPDRLLDGVQMRVDTRVDGGGRRRDARVEVEVEADRAAAPRPERREVAQYFPGHGHRHCLASPCRTGAILRLAASGSAVRTRRAGTASPARNATTSATAEAAKAIVNPRSVASPFTTVAATISGATLLRIAPPIVRTIVFIPVATPVCSAGTASTIRFAMEANANPIPMPITAIAR